MRGTHILVVLGTSIVMTPHAPARAQEATSARALLERAAEAMGGLTRLQGLDNFVMTGFGQRYSLNGNISADANSPPKWQAVADAQRSFDLRRGRALNQERNSYMFPFALSFGHSWNRTSTAQTGRAMLDHPLPALLRALAPGTALGPVTVQDGLAVVPFTLDDGTPMWMGLDQQTRLPYWTRWITGSDTLGDVTNTAYFTGYVPFNGVMLPLGLMTRIDWRNQITSMFQADSYRINSSDMPEFPEQRARGLGGRRAPPQVAVNKIADGVWDVDVVSGNPIAALGDSGGAVVEFTDHLVMFEAYGSGEQTLARIDAANRLVPGKAVASLIISHHHDDHAAGLRAAVSRGIAIIGQARNQKLYEEWVSRPAVYFPDELSRHPQPLRFIPVDEHLTLQDSLRRLDVYHVVANFHMSDAVIAYLPAERIIMEGDFTDQNYEFNWWGYSLRGNIEHYGLDPLIDIPVHGSVGPIQEKLARTREQVEAAQAFCARSAERGIYPFGCPVQYTTTGPVELKR